MSAGHPLRAEGRAAHRIPKTIGTRRIVNGSLDDKRIAAGAQGIAKQLSRRRLPVLRDRRVNNFEQIGLKRAYTVDNLLKLLATMPVNRVAVARELAQEALVVGNHLRPVEIATQSHEESFTQAHPRPADLPGDFRKHAPLEKLERRRP